MPRNGTLVICVQNLDFSGANQVVLNIVAGRMHESNVVVVSPKVGSFAARFVDSGAAVRVGDLASLLLEIRDVFCILCNTIMTASIVVEMSSRSHPVIWILHEWWDDDMITDNLRIRNMQGLTLNTVKQALERAAMVVFVCESQRQLYKPLAPSTVIFVGVPDPVPRISGTDNGGLHVNGDGSTVSGAAQLDLLAAFQEKEMLSTRQSEPGHVFTFLCLGIVCPRKNQLWTIEIFKKFAKDKTNVRLVVVGARRTRLYEIEYLEKIQAAIGDDPNIELHDVTDNVDPFFAMADCLVLTSLNEVTPMVISEAMSWCLPVLSTNIAGIKEMFTDGVEGFLFAPGDETKALEGMNAVYADPQLRRTMAHAARVRFETVFDLNLMVEAYQRLVMRVAPPVILVDMDGVLVDWDAGFMRVWDHLKAPVFRERSYFMEQCVGIEHNHAAELISLSEGFFLSLDPMTGALQALREMEEDGLQVYLCTAPNLKSQYCVQEKLNWVRRHLGERWLQKVILTHDKTVVRGDVLIDDKPLEFLWPGGKHSTASWKQILFDAPYNRQQVDHPRLVQWSDWKDVLYPLLGKGLLHLEDDRDVEQQPHREVRPQYGDDMGTATASTAGIAGIAEGDDEAVTPTAVLSAVMEGVPPPQYTTYRSGGGAPRRAGRPITVCTSRASLSKDKGYRKMSASEIQHSQDLLNVDQEPLSPEDIASIVSGSASLLEDDPDYPWEALLDELSMDDIGELVDSATAVARAGGDMTSARSAGDGMSSKALKKRELQDKLMEIKQTHRKERSDTELRAALEDDSMDGLQIFKQSYRNWKNKKPSHSSIF